MTDVQMIKAMLLQAAYEGAAAALGNAAPVKADPTVQDADLRTRNLAIYEVAKVHYAALVNAFQDKTGIWPDPVLPAATPAVPAANGATVPHPGSELANIANTVAGVAGAVAPVLEAAAIAGS